MAQEKVNDYKSKLEKKDVNLDDPVGVSDSGHVLYIDSKINTANIVKNISKNSNLTFTEQSLLASAINQVKSSTKSSDPADVMKLNQILKTINSKREDNNKITQESFKSALNDASSAGIFTSFINKASVAVSHVFANPLLQLQDIDGNDNILEKVSAEKLPADSVTLEESVKEINERISKLPPVKQGAIEALNGNPVAQLAALQAAEFLYPPKAAKVKSDATLAEAGTSFGATTTRNEMSAEQKAAAEIETLPSVAEAGTSSGATTTRVEVGAEVPTEIAKLAEGEAVSQNQQSLPKKPIDTNNQRAKAKARIAEAGTSSGATTTRVEVGAEASTEIETLPSVKRADQEYEPMDEDEPTHSTLKPNVSKTSKIKRSDSGDIQPDAKRDIQPDKKRRITQSNGATKANQAGANKPSNILLSDTIETAKLPAEKLPDDYIRPLNEVLQKASSAAQATQVNPDDVPEGENVISGRATGPVRKRVLKASAEAKADAGNSSRATTTRYEMSAEEKAKVNPDDAPEVENVISGRSTGPVRRKVITDDAPQEISVISRTSTGPVRQRVPKASAEAKARVEAEIAKADASASSGATSTGTPTHQ